MEWEGPQTEQVSHAILHICPSYRQVYTGALQSPAEGGLQLCLHPQVTPRSPHLHSGSEFLGQSVAFARGSRRLQGKV